MVALKKGFHLGVTLKSRATSLSTVDSQNLEPSREIKKGSSYWEFQLSGDGFLLTPLITGHILCIKTPENYLKENDIKDN